MPTPTPDERRQDPPLTSTGMGGAGDDNSGGGNASGTPDADTGMLAEDVVNKGDVKEDRAKLFPNAGHQTLPDAPT